MKHVHKTPRGICAQNIEYEIDEAGLVHNVKFLGGCMGNGQGLAAMVEGLPVAEVIKRLKGTQCRFGTSCPDQLAIALESEDSEGV